MGAPDFLRFLPRGLSSQDAQAYLGLKRATWDTLREQLQPVRLGTSLVYDRHDLDVLFERLKAGATATVDESHESAATVSELLGKITADAGQQKSVTTTCRETRASTKARKQGAGTSTKNIGDRAFEAALLRLRKHKNTSSPS